MDLREILNEELKGAYLTLGEVFDTSKRIKDKHPEINFQDIVEIVYEIAEKGTIKKELNCEYLMTVKDMERTFHSFKLSLDEDVYYVFDILEDSEDNEFIGSKFHIKGNNFIGNFEGNLFKVTKSGEGMDVSKFIDTLENSAPILNDNNYIKKILPFKEMYNLLNEGDLFS